MNVRGWMKTIPKDVIVRVDLWIGSQGGQGGPGAIGEAEPDRIKNQRDEDGIDIHQFDIDSMQKCKLEELDFKENICGHHKAFRCQDRWATSRRHHGRQR